MRIETIDKLWKESHPTGIIAHARSKGAFLVSYEHGKRLYTYRASSIYALAERLDLIPTTDMWHEAPRIVNALLAGAESIVGICGAGDTCRHLLRDSEWTVSEGWGEDDEYDRPTSTFVLESKAAHSEWSCTIAD